eukprot:TRINITY_DN4897_c0_g1_i5.p1 TRINITY_DN4897_c0_g1~~TRINITY_DN4897_c0_g1_i5.p1  ORF type:complete len:248 (+),score=41.78 TRINITY_DN4897_c0_g1_i5:538-1281(+)
MTQLVWESIIYDNLNFAGIQRHGISLISNEIYIFGGLYHCKYQQSLYKLTEDQEVVIIEEKSLQIPEQRAGHSQIVMGNKIIVIGGVGENTLFNDYHVFNTEDLKWNEMSFTGEIPPTREFFTITKLGKSSFVLFGGYLCVETAMDNFKETNFNDFYILSLPFLEWKKLKLSGDIPQGRSTHTAIAYNKKVFIFGGIIREASKEKVLNDTYLIDFGTLNEELQINCCLLYTSPSPRDRQKSRMPSSA